MNGIGLAGCSREPVLRARQVAGVVDVEAQALGPAERGEIQLADDAWLERCDRGAQRALCGERLPQLRQIARQASGQQRLQLAVHLGHRGTIELGEPAQQGTREERHVTREQHDGGSRRALGGVLQRGNHPAKRMARLLGLLQHRLGELRQARSLLGDDDRLESGVVGGDQRVADQRSPAERDGWLGAAETFATSPGEHGDDRFGLGHGVSVALQWRGDGDAGMIIHVRLFAMLRERAGAGTLELELGDGATVADAIRALSEREPLGTLLERMPVRMAVNRDYASAETVLSAQDELALIPPVSGGSPELEARARLRPVHVRVTAEPLSLDRLSHAVADSSAGAVEIFQGVTGKVERLDYEASTEMAQERMEAILRDCIAAHGLCAAAAEHRVESVALGEPSVIVAVSAPHRDEAFAGAREAIDRIKAEAPIWKREHESGLPGRWVAGSEPPS